jgi:hypothetical protein
MQAYCVPKQVKSCTSQALQSPGSAGPVAPTTATFIMIDAACRLQLPVSQTVTLCGKVAILIGGSHLDNTSGSLAMFAAIRSASSLLSNLAAELLEGGAAWPRRFNI